MKKIILLLTVVFVIMMVFSLAGCKEDATMSKDDRIEEFVSDLNKSNRDGIFKDHFHSDSTSYANGDEDSVDPVFPNVSGGYSYKVVSITGDNPKTVAITCSGDGVADGNYTFTMKEEDADDWYILKIIGVLGNLQ